MSCLPWRTSTSLITPILDVSLAASQGREIEAPSRTCATKLGGMAKTLQATAWLVQLCNLRGSTHLIVHSHDHERMETQNPATDEQTTKLVTSWHTQPLSNPHAFHAYHRVCRLACICLLDLPLCFDRVHFRLATIERKHSIQVLATR
jgi:hypothetical protein